MKLQLVFVDTPNHAKTNLSRFLESLNVRTWYLENVGAVAEAEFDGPAFLVTPYLSFHEFQHKRAEFRKLYGRDQTVAILDSTDYQICADAFRAGAKDVLLSPYTSRELERLVQSLYTHALQVVHPDAIIPLETVERLAIKEAILACNGQVSRTSRKLGIGRSTLYRKMEQYGLDGIRVRDQA